MNDTTLPPSSAMGDVSVRKVPKLLGKEELQQYSKLDGSRFTLAVMMELCIIALTIAVCERYWSYPLYAFAVVIIGARLHGLAILMHEATHYRAYNTRWLNDAAGELLAWMVAFTMQGYRNNHFAHHRELNNDKDPDWVRKQGDDHFKFPKSAAQMARTLLHHISGIGMIAVLGKFNKSSHAKSVSGRVKLARAVFYLCLLASAIAFGFWKQLLLYWLVPFLTTFWFFANIRSIAEHFALDYSHILKHIRTVMAPSWELWLFAPHGINYHIEHHLYPSVPFFRLGALHRYLMSKNEYATNAHITQGYIVGLFRECTTGPSESALKKYA